MLMLIVCLFWRCPFWLLCHWLVVIWWRRVQVGWWVLLVSIRDRRQSQQLLMVT